MYICFARVDYKLLAISLANGIQKLTKIQKQQRCWLGRKGLVESILHQPTICRSFWTETLFSWRSEQTGAFGRKLRSAEVLKQEPLDWGTIISQIWDALLELHRNLLNAIRRFHLYIVIFYCVCSAFSYLGMIFLFQLNRSSEIWYWNEIFSFYITWLGCFSFLCHPCSIQMKVEECNSKSTEKY